MRFPSPAGRAIAPRIDHGGGKEDVIGLHRPGCRLWRVGGTIDGTDVQREIAVRNLERLTAGETGDAGDLHRGERLEDGLVDADRLAGDDTRVVVPAKVCGSLVDREDREAGVAAVVARILHYCDHGGAGRRAVTQQACRRRECR